MRQSSVNMAAGMALAMIGVNGLTPSGRNPQGPAFQDLPKTPKHVDQFYLSAAQEKRERKMAKRASQLLK
jgi:hypothetical protein